MSELEPLPYHRRILEFLKRDEARVWEWFRSEKFRGEHAEAVRVQLLKSSFRLEREAHPDVYAAADDVARILGITDPVTLYQSQQTDGDFNASYNYVPNELHVLLIGPLSTKLAPLELRALLGHEFAHHVFCSRWEGEFFSAEQAINGMAGDPDSHVAHGETCRLFNLYTELFADRGSLHVAQDPRVVVSLLAKMATGAETADGDAFLKQADEVYARDSAPSEGVTHPEHFMRARALRLWAEQGDAAHADVEKMIEGPLAVEALDLPRQQEAVLLTRRLVEQVLQPDWIRSDTVLAHARLFFDDATPAQTDDPALYEAIRKTTPLSHDYFCYVLLDFAACDPALEEQPLRAALAMADRFGARPRLLELATRELGLSRKTLQSLKTA